MSDSQLQIDRPPSVSYGHYRKTVKGLGAVVSHEALKRAFEPIEAGLLAARHPRIPLAALRHSLEALAAEQDAPLLLVDAFSRLDFSTGFLRRTYLSGAHTVAEALFLSRRYLRLTSDLAIVKTRVDKSQAILQLIPHPDFANSVLQLDGLAYAQLRVLRELGVQNIECLTVPHTPPAEVQADYDARFPVRLVFDAPDYRISFPAIELARAIGWQHEDVSGVARRERKLIKHDPTHRWTDSVAVLLTVLLRSGEGSIDRCAELLAVSRRTLQRRVEAEGEVFRPLLEATRKRLCLEYLAGGYADETIALLLGYRQTAQFYRAFRSWFDTSPGRYRQRLHAQHALAPNPPSAATLPPEPVIHRRRTQ